MSSLLSNINLSVIRYSKCLQANALFEAKKKLKATRQANDGKHVLDLYLVTVDISKLSIISHFRAKVNFSEGGGEAIDEGRFWDNASNTNDNGGYPPG